MTIGEKLVHLRIVNGISQEKFAEYLNVSRQSVSKWESDESIPQLDKILEIAKYFKISTDELIDDNITIHRGRKIKPFSTEHIKTKYFGTDGFRGEVNNVLTCGKAYMIGRFLGWFYSNPKYNAIKPGYKPNIVIGKDTRRSSYMLEFAVASGCAASGANVELMHVTTTPSIAFAITRDGFDCGVMITASHNPFFDNGIKVLNSSGEKLEDYVASLAEAYIDGDLKKLEIEDDDLPYAKREDIGAIGDYSSGRNRYIAYLISLARNSMKNLKVGLDCSNGSSWMIAPSVFEALGAQTFVINNKPDGININTDCGSTHIEHLCKYVKDNKLDIGFAFDGDADRCLAVDEHGNVVDGDKIMYLLANKLKNDDALHQNTLVATIMSNSGLTKALKNKGIQMIRTKVGDRYVFEKMQEEDYSLGGEQSGHIIIKKYATTGDGILTAIMVADEVLNQKTSLSKLVAPVKLLPQKLRNVKVTSKEATVNDEFVIKKVNEVTKSLGDNGRVLLRESGTEPVIRIMVEAPTLEECDKYIDTIYQVIKKRGFISE